MLYFAVCSVQRPRAPLIFAKWQHHATGHGARFVVHGFTVCNKLLTDLLTYSLFLSRWTWAWLHTVSLWGPSSRAQSGVATSLSSHSKSPQTNTRWLKNCRNFLSVHLSHAATSVCMTSVKFNKIRIVVCLFASLIYLFTSDNWWLTMCDLIDKRKRKFLAKYSVKWL